MKRWVPSLGLLAYLATLVAGNEVKLVSPLRSSLASGVIMLILAETRRRQPATMQRHVQPQILGWLRRAIHPR